MAWDGAGLAYDIVSKEMTSNATEVFTENHTIGSGSPLALPLGAYLTDGGTMFRAWTTIADGMSVVVRSPRREHWEETPLRNCDGGIHEALLDVPPGSLYRFKLNGLELPDPYARFLPQGVHGPAEVVEPRYRWLTANWKGLSADNILYELHVGTFTGAGTYRAAIERLPELASLGVTAIELMP